MAAYRLPTDRRGIVSIGPLQVVVSDPFGLVDLATPAAPEVQLTVLPHVDVVTPLPYTAAHDPQAGIRQLNALGRTGEEFYALRPFAVGDDLRRVHWPQSARVDELLIRQNEEPWQGRTTVVLDTREATHRGESLEVAVSAAASVVAATTRRQDLVRLVTTAGYDSDFAPGQDHVQALMEHLAVVPTSSGADLGQAIDVLQRRSSGGRARGRRGGRARPRSPCPDQPSRPVRLGDRDPPRSLRLGPPSADRPVDRSVGAPGHP